MAVIYWQALILAFGIGDYYLTARLDSQAEGTKQEVLRGRSVGVRVVDCDGVVLSVGRLKTRSQADFPTMGRSPTVLGPLLARIGGRNGGSCPMNSSIILQR